jgi:glucose-6-phosphate dehydrogenase assembly protein OpcA
MIIPLYDTTANQIADELVAVRREGGAVALTRVLTLLVPVGTGNPETAIQAANEASMEHPCRVIVLVERDPSGQPTLDAEIRVGRDAGASEVVVLRLRGSLVDQQASVITPLLLPDVPVVAWWPHRMPGRPAATALGALAVHRVTNAPRAPGSVLDRLTRLAQAYTPGDTDLGWTRITWWRAHLAAILDQAPFEAVTAVTIQGQPGPSEDLLAAWLGWRLRCPVQMTSLGESNGLVRVELHRLSGTVAIDRPSGSDVAVCSMPGRADQRFYLSRRQLAECLSEELRRLDEDRVYGEVVTQGLAWLSQPGHLSEISLDAQAGPTGQAEV